MELNADGVATFPNGLKLRLTPKHVSGQAIYDTAARYPDPPVPVRTVTVAGREESEENPDDPDYKQAVALAKDRRAWAVVRTLGVLGTELVEPPPGVPGPDEVDWDRIAYVRDLPTPTSRYERYELWLRYYAFAHGYPALKDGLDAYVGMIQYLALEGGITMEAPSAVAASFRDTPAGPAGADGAVVAPEVDGNVGGHPPAGRLV